MQSVILIHYAEIGLKGRNRKRFTRRLCDRIRQVLASAGVDAGVRVDSSRLAVPLRPGMDADRALRAILRVPGVANAAYATCVQPDVEAMKAAALERLEAAEAGSFKVVVRRSDKTFPLTSPELAVLVGEHCADTSGRPVDVHEPTVRVRIEVVRGSAFVSAGTQRGAGGLPVGSTTNLLAFLSGGLDSPVAAWQMIRRGARVSGVHFHNRSFQGAAVLEKIQDLAGVLAWSAGQFPLYVVPFEACQRAIVGSVPGPYRMIVYRRAMLRIAARLARPAGALGYVTGDSLGQVASQTAENLRTIQAVADLPVYAPLVGSDKVDIIDLARRIGTYDISIRPHDDCCSFLVPKHPAVESTPTELIAHEADLDWDALVDEAIAKTDRSVIAPDLDAL